MKTFIILCISVMLSFSFLGLFSAISFIISVIFEINNFDGGRGIFLFFGALITTIFKPIAWFIPEIKGFFSVVITFLLGLLSLFLFVAVFIFPANKFYEKLCDIKKASSSLFFQVILFILLFYAGWVAIIAFYKVLMIILEGKFSGLYHLYWMFGFVIWGAVLYEKRRFLGEKTLLFKSLFAIFVYAFVIIAEFLVFFYPFAHMAVGIGIREYYSKYLIIFYTICYIPIFILINMALRKYINKAIK